MSEPINPFPIHGYFGPELFCNRDDEKDMLIEAVRNGRNITLFAPRRIGKSALIHHVFHFLHPKWSCIYLDVQESSSFKDFTNLFLTSVLNGVKRQKTLFNKVQEWLLSFRPVLSTNPHTGSFEVEIDFKSDAQQQTSIKSAFQLLDSQGPTVIALDEFQHIHSWDEGFAVESWLRSEIQHLKNVRFIFSGSQFHLLTEMFQSAKRPFFASTQPMNIGKIEMERYRIFIGRMFQAHGKAIRTEEIDCILEWADGNTYNVQLLCNRIFSKASKKVEQAMIDESIIEIYAENKLSYFALRNSMSKYQWQVLTAIAIEGMVFAPTARDFLKKYDLGAGPSVLRAMEYLLSRELVYQYYQDNGEKYYQVYDIILMRWLQKK
ncbi:MAG: AAA family ATPase [Cyclobacteriaceae bacterium]|nr:AAA family ATPase [Cyclobacteriaceae bacterium]UYN86764.1 MAG: AAA family ATPase [Cyclobacteriaceae bacterium]